MLPPSRQSVSRRGFLAAMLATSAATSVFAVSAREGNAAPWPAEASLEPLSTTAHAVNQRADNVAQAAHNNGEHTMLNQITTPSAQGIPTIVLVHGAFADSSSWNGVIARLLAQGYSVIAVPNPLRGVTADAAYVASVLQGIPGPIVLVGHSYGGAVITNAATGNSNVVGLIYVAAYAPDAGETLGELSDRFPDRMIGPTLSPPVALPDGGSERFIQQDKFWQVFAPDIPEADAKLAAATQRPIAGAAFTDISGPPAWKTIPSQFIYGDQDKVIVPALHSFLADRAGSGQTVVVNGASHVVMISRADEVAEMIHQSVLAHATTPTGA